MQIKTIPFNWNEQSKLKEQAQGKNWPVVYLIHNDTDMYIGETLNVYKRMSDHLKNPIRNNLKLMEIMFDDETNKSVILDYEQKLIKCMKTENKFSLQNRVDGQSREHDYFNRPYYKTKFNEFWNKLREKKLASLSLLQIENSDLYKYSPYSTLTSEQLSVSNAVLTDFLIKLSTNTKGISIVNGCAGTGKTILAINMINTLLNGKDFEFDLSEDYENDGAQLKEIINKLKEWEKNNHKLKIGIVFPMSGIRTTIAKVFKQLKNNFKTKMVLNPYDVVNENYDIVFVDEAHRLKKWQNIGQESDVFSHNCEIVGLNKETSNQLDIILKSCKYTVLFFDKDQSIRSNDINFNEFNNSLQKSGLPIRQDVLTCQMRCEGRSTFVDYVKSIFNCEQNEFKRINLYDFALFEDVDKMINTIKKLDKTYKLCRTTAGYSWKWNTKQQGTLDEIRRKGLFDIEINGNKYIWNLDTKNWINRADSIETIGCIHTTQGYDLNYVAVIFGKEIDYNPQTNKITIDTSKFYDKKSIQGVKDPEEIKRYIVNAYTTMMFRGIKGCYVYACNKNLQEYLAKFIKPFVDDSKN